LKVALIDILRFVKIFCKEHVCRASSQSRGKSKVVFLLQVAVEEYLIVLSVVSASVVGCRCVAKASAADVESGVDIDGFFKVYDVEVAVAGGVESPVG